MAIILNTTEVYVASNGSILETSGNSIFHAQSNYANLYLLYLEDGVSEGSSTFINFTPDNRTAYTSHWFFMKYQGIVSKTITGETEQRSFACFAITIPKIVLQNNNKHQNTRNEVTYIQRYGSKYLGFFADKTTLDTEWDLTAQATIDGYDSLGEQFATELNVAYVTDEEDKGYYQVVLDETTYVWQLTENIAQYLDEKQYNIGEIFVQKGFSNPSGSIPITTTAHDFFMTILNDLTQDVESLKENVVIIEQDIDDLETFKNVTVPATYETKEDATAHKARTTALETFKDTTVPATYETKADATTHKGRTTVLEGEMDDIQPKVSTLEGKVTTLESDVEQLKADTDGIYQSSTKLYVAPTGKDVSIIGNEVIEISANTQVSVESNEVVIQGFNDVLIDTDDLEIYAHVVEIIPTSYEPTTENGVLVRRQLDNHNTSEVAHLFIRTLIENLEQEIQRLDGRGKSFGEIPYTTEFLKAQDEQGLSELFRSYFEDNFPEIGTNWQNGYLVYDLGTGDGVAYHEWEFNGAVWVDNGLIGYTQASNTVHGMVKGDETYVSIVSGIIQVLLSDYATRVGDDEASYTYTQINEALTNRYTKVEVDALLEQLKAIYGWEDTDIAVLGDLDTVSNATLLDYDYVLLQVTSTDVAEFYIDTELVKTDLTIIADKEIQFDTKGGTPVTIGKFIVGATTSSFELEDNGTDYVLHIIGIKMSQGQAENTAFDGTGTNYLADETNVDEAIKELDVQVKATNDIKSSKVETREVGEYQIQFINGKLTSVVGDNVNTYLSYDTNGNVAKITETYADGKSYETTYTKDVEGRIKSLTKVEV